MKNRNLFFLFVLNLFLTASFAQTIDYGQSKAQIEFLNLDCLHERGFTGKGVTIAHFDDGYDGFDKMEAFKYAIKNDLLKGNYDFCFDTEIKYEGNGTHGTNTLSIVNGYLPGEYIGTGFDANILLAHTEYTPSETHKEEENWKRAVDWAIENGADIITSSLQYNNFDDGEGNYTYKDMDGNTSIIAKAADYAASKGVLVVAIQGNFGNDPWYYVATPGDADSVLTVGAAGVDGQKAIFSSFGPTSDGRVKPDVMAVGFQTIVVDPDGKIRPGNGTSFAAPCIAGMVACLKQAHPNRSNMEIITAVRQSSDRYLNPDIKGGYGFGVPDACKADEILTEMDDTFGKSGVVDQEKLSYEIKKNKLFLTPKFESNDFVSMQLFDAAEQMIAESSKFRKKIKLKRLKKGNYILKIKLKSGEVSVNNILI